MPNEQDTLTSSDFFVGFRSFRSSRFPPSDLYFSRDHISGWECAKRNSFSESSLNAQLQGSALSRLRPYGKHRE